MCLIKIAPREDGKSLWFLLASLAFYFLSCFGFSSCFGEKSFDSTFSSYSSDL